MTELQNLDDVSAVVTKLPMVNQATAKKLADISARRIGPEVIVFIDEMIALFDNGNRWCQSHEVMRHEVMRVVCAMGLPPSWAGRAFSFPEVEDVNRQRLDDYSFCLIGAIKMNDRKYLRLLVRGLIYAVVNKSIGQWNDTRTNYEQVHDKLRHIQTLVRAYCM